MSPFIIEYNEVWASEGHTVCSIYLSNDPIQEIIVEQFDTDNYPSLVSIGKRLITLAGK